MPDVTEFELRCAMLAPPDLFTILTVASASARIAALREVRSRRRDLSQLEWEESVVVAYAGLLEHQRQNPTALLSAVAAVRPRTSRSPYGGLTVDRIVDALVHWRGDWPPSQDALADEALLVTDRRVRQVLSLGRRSWRSVIDEARAIR